MSGSPQPTAHCPPLACPPTGYLLALGPLLFISICDVWLQLFSRDQAYAINLVAVSTVAFGCTGRDRGGAGGRLSPKVPTAPIPPQPCSPAWDILHEASWAWCCLPRSSPW